MKRLMILILIAGLMFAVKPVPRKDHNKESKQKSKFSIESVIKGLKKIVDKKGDKEKDDHFQDADSNGVNDQREDDFQKIKQLKTKHKDKDSRGTQKKTVKKKSTVSPKKSKEKKDK